jgi:hypothetical protein
MERYNRAAGAASAPTAPSAPTNKYFTEGNPGGGVPATQPGPWWFHMISEELRQCLTDAGLTPDHTNLTQLSAAIRILSVGQVMIVTDQKSSGTNAGASLAGVQARVFNTVDANTISGASLASNQITLPAGTYRVLGWAPAGNVGYHRARLYNVTDSANTILGSSENCTSASISDLVQTTSHLFGRFTIAGTKVFELRHYTSQVETNWGLGIAVSEASINEVYARLVITKE